jgi:hypothetical protein
MMFRVVSELACGVVIIIVVDMDSQLIMGGRMDDM